MNKEIAELLKKTRQEKGLSLEEVYRGTKIQPGVLRYLEEGIAAERLGEMYAKSFLKIYARFLSLDINLLLKDEKPEEKLEKPQRSPNADWKVASDLKKLFFDQLEKINIKIPQIKQVPKGKIKYVVIAVVVLVAILIFANTKKTNLSTQETSKTPPAPSRKVATKKSAIEPLTLLIRAKEDSWLQVKCDSKVVFQRVLTKGSVEKWEANDKIELWVGNAAGLMVELNGQSIGPLGRRGQVIRNIVMTKEGVIIGK